MGKQRLAFLLALIAVAGLAVRCNGGVTSAFRRKLAASVDMPLDADVFQVPAGYNAPQQVRIKVFNQFCASINFEKCIRKFVRILRFQKKQNKSLLELGSLGLD